MNEEWKKVQMNPGYSVSNLGRIRHDTNGKILKPFKIGDKEKHNQYFAVDIGNKKSVRVHRLVAIAFLPPSDKPQINHKDGDHFNNAVSNLEWVTGSENCFHSYNVLGRERFLGSNSPSAKKVVRVEDGKIYGSLADATQDNNLSSHTSISRAIKESNRTAGGYHWKYAEVCS